MTFERCDTNMNRLRDLRKEKQLSQKEIADFLGINEKTISRWENGESTIKSDKAQQLAEYFGVNVGYLLGYTEQSPDEEKIKLGYQSIIELNDELIENPSKKDEVFPKIDKIMKDIAIETGRKQFYQLKGSAGIQQLAEYLTNRQIKIIDEELSKTPGLKKAKEVTSDTIEILVERFFHALSKLPELETELLANFVTLSHSDKTSILSIVKSLSND